MLHEKELTGMIVDEAFHLHKDLGPGLLESVNCTLLAHRLRRRGLNVEQEKLVIFEYDGIVFEQG
jgi:GxxExxY protein